MAVKIKSVIENSPAFHAGIKSGDILVSLDGNSISDVLDYMFYAAESKVKVCCKRDCETYTTDISKSEYDDLGLEFDTFLMDKKTKLHK